MSADNYYVIDRHPDGGYCAVMCFASDDKHPDPQRKDRQFKTIKEASDWAWGEYSEYGVSLADRLGVVERPGEGAL